jgi:hypothetical protein
MRGAPAHVVVEAIVFLALCVIAVGCLAYALWRQRAEAKSIKLPAWRRIVAGLGFFAVTAQAVVLVVYWVWPQIGRDYVLFGKWARWVLPSFLVAIPLVLFGQGSSRWWLLSSSVLLFVICFFIVLSA